MLRRVEIEEQRVSYAAREFGFSRPSFYQAQAAFEQGGLAGLFPQKHGPRDAHKLNQAVMQFVEEMRAAQPALGWPELAQRVHQRFGLTVHPRSIERGLARRQKKRR
jgi:transposase